MKRRTRINFTPEQKAIIWDRYKQGDSLHDIARYVRQISFFYYAHYPPDWWIPPPVRKRHPLALSLDEREEISRALVAKISIRAIANKLSRAPSTISREIKRHGGAKQYRASKADTAAWENALRPKPCKLIERPTLCKIIAEKMHQDWSPEQIAGWLKRCYPDNQEMHVSHETIYKTLFIQTRGALKKNCSNASEAEESCVDPEHHRLKGKD